MDNKLESIIEKEPNFLEWEEYGLQCVILRNMSMRHLCGYVGVTKSHPLYKKEYDSLDDSLHVHGGITFSNFIFFNGFKKADYASDEECKDLNEKYKDVWFFGFDCAHFDDICPGNYRIYEKFNMMNNDGLNSTYKNIDFVKKETKEMARQLKDLNGE